MKVKGKHYRTVWMQDKTVYLIDQSLLPFKFNIIETSDYRKLCEVIKNMNTRGAGAIGATAGFAMALAIDKFNNNENLHKSILKAKKEIEATRPTARNLFYATNRVYRTAQNHDFDGQTAINEARKISEEDIADCKKIGEYGNELIKDGFNIETHCNAGWLGFSDVGSALAPIYIANQHHKKIHVFVDETRPRNQGSRLTAWELTNENIPYTIIPDNTGAFLMQQGKIDMMIVGADRIAANGDVANKIGTLEKAIAAAEYNVPFYVAAPFSTIDFSCPSGKNIDIEARDKKEILTVFGNADSKIGRFHVTNKSYNALNIAFDVTPAKFITGIITEKGIFKPDDLKNQFKFKKE